MSAIAIHVSGLTYSHRTTSTTPALLNVHLSLALGSRTLLIGANGAGKSTLLQILAGKRLVSAQGAVVHLLGKDVFRDFPSGVTFLGTEW
jgi:CCR4-NOT complex subunit CAF16